MSPADAAPLVFTASPLDRASHLRRDADWLAARRIDPKSRYLPLCELKPLIRIGPRPEIAWLPAARVAGALADGANSVMLGLRDGHCHFALELPPGSAPEPGTRYIDTRTIAPQLAAGEAAILAQARSLIDWHARHRFCAACGAETMAREGGHLRACASCPAQHFPRTDPVVIMLAVKDDRCVLGRQRRFPPGMYSALAGYVEPGETIEDAVRREILEEAGIAVDGVRYLASQPWPFPASLMIGCIAQARGEEIAIDRHELDDARWFSRDTVSAMAAHSLDMNAQPRLPPPLSLAHRLALLWLAP
jgi:NAD+ diphosphatase